MTIEINNITLRQIWNSVNITTILLPNIYENKFPKLINTDGFNYPFIYILYEYGLLNIFIDKSKKTIHLLFNYNKCINDKYLTTSQISNIIDYVSNTIYFNNVIVYNKKLLKIELDIPFEYLKDIDLITKGQYSKTSTIFKNSSKIHYNKVPYIKNNIPRYIIRNNLSFMILDKNVKLKNQLEEMLKTVINEDSEYFVEFNQEKEYWSDAIIDEYLNKF